MGIGGEEEKQEGQVQEGRHQGTLLALGGVETLRHGEARLHADHLSGDRGDGHEDAGDRPDHQSGDDFARHQRRQHQRLVRQGWQAGRDHRREKEADKQRESEPDADRNARFAETGHEHQDRPDAREDETARKHEFRRLGNHGVEIRSNTTVMKPDISPPISGRKISSAMKMAMILGTKTRVIS